MQKYNIHLWNIWRVKIITYSPSKKNKKPIKYKGRKHRFTPDCEEPYNMSRNLVFILQATWNEEGYQKDTMQQKDNQISVSEWEFLWQLEGEQSEQIGSRESG